MPSVCMTLWLWCQKSWYTVLPYTLATILVNHPTDEYASLDQNSCNWIQADTRHLNLTISHLPDFGLHLCKSITDIPWHHTSIRIQQIPESSRINAASAKNSRQCVCLHFEGYWKSENTLQCQEKNKMREPCCRI